ncbi:hypothetical protein KFE96_00175 [Kordiimonas sp. SCSIO 12603]|uniref:hypothetical protein n=1 Tax=Kordiimonas sp. SCSIO 12603 TaxID=2829596 RepID=UPI002104C325|nr:hypothetical protein [Kordiimonas sp. SCSIO 12603]UTW58758.1 hypothetical protein KFE96_00175 [Kordiimonas sp. SCSIO 12603]
MPHSSDYDDEIGLDFDDSPSRFFEVRWPVSEVVLSTALNSGRSLETIADTYGVSVSEVIDLCEIYDLDIG